MRENDKKTIRNSLCLCKKKFFFTHFIHSSCMGKTPLLILTLTSDGSGFGFYHGEMGSRQVEQGFSSFFGRPENDPGRKLTQVLKTENVPGFNF